MNTKTCSKCRICGNEISQKVFLYDSGLCRSCSQKIRWSKIPKKSKKKCIDCESKVSFYAKRCKLCSNKERMNRPEEKLKARLKFLGKNNPKYIDGRTTKQYYCIDCGKEICMITGIYGGQKCLSCARTIHGLSNLPYTGEFTKKLKQQIQKRDNYKCQYCGMTQKEHFKKYGRDIEVHHIDYCPANCKEDNLIILCRKCNTTVNYNRDYYYAYFIYIMKENKRVIIQNR